MKVRDGNLWGAWHPGPYATVITTNGSLTKDHKAVMGRGVAREAADMYPELKRLLGVLLENTGNHCYVLPVLRGPDGHAALVSFPVKHRWDQTASLQLIERSAAELVLLRQAYGWDKVYLPRPGCGNGGLAWDAVRRVLRPIFQGEQFVVVYEDGHDEPKKERPKSGKAVVKRGV